MMSKAEVIKILNNLLEFLKSVNGLANSHFASVFSEDLWCKNIPKEIQQELNNKEQIIEFISEYPKIMKNNFSNEYCKKHPFLTTYLKNAVNFSIMSDNKFSKSLIDLENHFLSLGYKVIDDFSFEEFMSPKKLHEVKKLSRITAFLKNMTNSSHVVDVGGGKGYLSSVLALHHFFKVLGLDSSEVTTCGAVKRSEKVAKLWNSSENKKSGEEVIKNHYKQTTTFVKPQTDVLKLVEESFDEEVEGLTLTGLHTCGDLAVTSLKMFVNNDKIKAVVNVGCCYHLLTERNLGSGKDDLSPEENEFPLSKFLKDKNFKLGHNARMLASHSLDRYNSKSELEFSQTSLFYRAILETLVKDSKEIPSEQVRVKRIAKKCSNFNEYMQKALKKLNIKLELTDSDLEKLFNSFLEKKPQLTAFFLLRVTLAPIIESIILLDRILYLIENDINNAYLVRLFDLKISPRGFGIIAWKDLKNS